MFTLEKRDLPILICAVGIVTCVELGAGLGFSILDFKNPVLIAVLLLSILILILDVLNRKVCSRDSFFVWLSIGTSLPMVVAAHRFLSSVKIQDIDVDMFATLESVMVASIVISAALSVLCVENTVGKIAFCFLALPVIGPFFGILLLGYARFINPSFLDEFPKEVVRSKRVSEPQGT